MSRLAPTPTRLALLLSLLVCPPAPAEDAALASEPVATPAAPAADDPLTGWLEEVAPLVTARERTLFESLERDYQRRAFVEEFWKVRDPHPRTARNELKERWPLRVAEARMQFGSLTDDRSRILLVHDRPAARLKVTCAERNQPAEVWVYEGSDLLRVPFILVFVRPRPDAEARIWQPDRGFFYDDVLQRARGCPGGHRLTQAMRVLESDPGAYRDLLGLILAKPKPRSSEWVDVFAAQSTELPQDATPLPARLDVAFPGRHQLRTVIDGVVSVPAVALGVAEYAGYRSHELRLVGEVLQDGDLFDRFRYQYGFSATAERDAVTTLPLAFQRYLRPGTYRLVLRVDDLASTAAERIEREIVVPAADGPATIARFVDPRTADLFAEATAAVAAGETGVRIVPPRDGLLAGFIRFDTLVSGEDVAGVRFLLDDVPVVTKNRPPYNVELDMGVVPALHTLRVEALDGAGREVAADELLLNAGGYRFTAKLVEPRRGRRYEKSLLARVEVAVPEGRSLDRVELYLDEARVATLYQEPYVHPVALPAGDAVSYVRAVAYLPDGNSTEDLVFVNAPDYLDEIEVQMVELFTTVLGRDGRPVPGLAREAFTVFEDGERQEIARFERVEDLPVHVGVMIDSSASMGPVLDEARKAALGFFRDAITPRDRAAVITFNAFPNLTVELTNDPTALGRGLAGLVAEGRTALYDSVMFGLYYLAGVKGQRALLLLSDGKDESSRFGFDETLEYARRAGITLYPIALRSDDPAARRRLELLADATGGRSFALRGIEDLDDVYAAIQRELRSQYLIAYQSSQTNGDGRFRTVQLEVDRAGAVAKTIQGYYP